VRLDGAVCWHEQAGSAKGFLIMAKDDKFDPTVETTLHGMNSDDGPIVGAKVSYFSREKFEQDFDRWPTSPHGKVIERKTAKEFKVIHLSAIKDRQVAIVDGLDYVFLIEIDEEIMNLASIKKVMVARCPKCGEDVYDFEPCFCGNTLSRDLFKEQEIANIVGEKLPDGN